MPSMLSRSFLRLSSARCSTASRFRTAPIIGPSVDNFLTRYLNHKLVPTVLGFDPLWQFLHEADAVAGECLADRRDLLVTHRTGPRHFYAANRGERHPGLLGKLERRPAQISARRADLSV